MHNYSKAHTAGVTTRQLEITAPPLNTATVIYQFFDQSENKRRRLFSLKFLQKIRRRLFIFLACGDFALKYVLKIFACGAKRRRLFLQNFEIQEKERDGYLSLKICPKVLAAVI